MITNATISILARIAPVLRLARISTAFAAIANAWFVILWTRAVSNERPADPADALAPDGPALWLVLLSGAAAAIGLYAFGACLNDVMDSTRDRAMRRDRPLAGGHISPVAAVTVGAISLIVATLGAVIFGNAAVVLTCGLALAILGFNVLGKFVPAIGLVLLSFIYAGHMLVPNLDLRFLWPVWVVMTHSIIVSGVVHVVSRKPPPLTPRAFAGAAAGWLTGTAVLAWLTMGRSERPDAPILDRLWPDWVEPGGAIAVAMLACLFAATAVRRLRELGPGARTAEKINRYGALWLPLYASAWLFGEGLTGDGLLMLALAGTGLIGMSLLREAYAAAEHPIGYRR